MTKANPTRWTGATALLALLFLSSGCLTPTTPPPSEGADVPLCRPPCEVAVDTSDDRAFEPHVAVHPDDARRAVSVSTVFNGDADIGIPDRLKVHVTDDGGATFTSERFEDLLGPTNPVRRYTQWADPWLVWLPDGTLLLFGMGTMGSIPDAYGVVFTSYDIFLARSFDDGRTWPEGQILARGEGVMSPVAQTKYYDQPHVTITPDGSLLAGWIMAEYLPDGSRYQNVMATSSSDDGQTWSDLVTVAEGVLHNARPAAAADGLRYMAYRDQSGDDPWQPVHLAASSDGGDTWHPVDIGEVASRSRPSIVTTADEVHLLVAEAGENATTLVTLLTLGDEEVDREVLGRMNGTTEPIITLAGDPHGGLWATWLEAQQDGSNTFHAWHRAPDGTVRMQRLDSTPIGPNIPQGLIGWPALGDYFGIGANEDGAVVTWVSGAHQHQDVRAAWLSGNPS